MKYNIDLIDITQPAPEKEPERQYYFIAKCREIVKKQEEQLGRKLVCVVTNFGYPLVWVNKIRKIYVR